MILWVQAANGCTSPDTLVVGTQNCSTFYSAVLANHALTNGNIVLTPADLCCDGAYPRYRYS